jgi:hypothetical protein
LQTPTIIIGGILTGIFTPTESAIAAVVYSMFLGLFVYRTLTWRHILRVSMDTIETSAAILMIVASATIFAWILIDQQVAVILADALLGFSQNKTVILIIIMGVVLLDRLFHGDYRCHHHFGAGASSHRPDRGHRYGAPGHHRNLEPDAGAADPAGGHGALCAFQGFRG